MRDPVDQRGTSARRTEGTEAPLPSGPRSRTSSTGLVSAAPRRKITVSRDQERMEESRGNERVLGYTPRP